MSTSATDFQTKVDKTVVNMDRLDQIVNGDATTVVEVDNGVEVPSLAKLQTAAQIEVDAATSAAAAAEMGLQPIPVGGNFATGLSPINFGSWLIPPAAGATVATADVTLLGYGIKATVTLAPGATVALRCNLPSPYGNGDYVIGSVLILKQSAGAFPSGAFVDVDGVPIADGAHQAFGADGTLLHSESVNANLQRYVVGGRFSTLGGPLDFVYLAIKNTSSSSIQVAGFAVGLSGRYHNDLDWRIFDPSVSLPTIVRRAPIPIGGNLPNGAPAHRGSWFIPGTVVATANTTLNQLGITREAQVAPSDSGAYFRVDLDASSDDQFGNGDYVMISVIFRKSPADDWSSVVTGEYLTLATIQTDNAQPQPIAISACDAYGFEDLGANIRRYWLSAHYTMLTAPIRWFIIFPQNHSLSSSLWFSGFAIGLSHRPFNALDWTVFDPLDTGRSADRLATLEANIVLPQSTPDMLVQSSYSLIQGRPLRLLRDGLTSYREKLAYDIAAVGINGNEVGEEWAAPMMRLDGKQFSGAGFFRAKAKQRDQVALFQVPTQFFSSSAVKSGSPKILMIGDSLTNNGMPTAVHDKLTTSGVTPTFVGTLTDGGGTTGEGRPNWLATSFTYAYRFVNGHGVNGGQIYDVFPVRPNGGAGLTIAVSSSGGVVTSATASGGTGYPNGTWEVVFQNQSPNVGRRARGHIVVTGGVPGLITIDDGGAGYSGTVSATLTASVSEYLALGSSGSYGPRWNYNPFVRPATPAETSAADLRIHNGYIFDFQYYVTNFLGGVTPDQIVVCLGMNDLWLGGGTPASAFAAIKQIYDAIRLVSTTVPVAIAIPGQASIETWALFVTLIKLLMAQFASLETSQTYILPLFQVTDAKFVYGVTAPTATDAQTGMQTVQISDPTHPDVVGRSQASEMIFAWSMCRLP